MAMAITMARCICNRGAMVIGLRLQEGAPVVCTGNLAYEEVRRWVMVRPKQLGHANIRVRDLDRSEKFYTEVLGLKVNHRRGNIAFLSVREHSHELAIRAMGADAPGPAETHIGHHHFAWQLATLEHLEAM